MSRPGFVRIPRTNGKAAVIRADQITALLPQDVKGGGEELTIQLGTIVVHTTLSMTEIAAMVQNATGLPMTIVEPPAAEAA